MAADSSKPSGSCLGRLAVMITFFGMIGLGVALRYAYQAQDLSDIKGMGTAYAARPCRDLLTVMKLGIKKDYPVSIPEEELNLYLDRTLKGKQGDEIGGLVKIQGVHVRLKKDLAEVIIERSILGKTFTDSMYIAVEQTEEITGVVHTDIVRDGGPYVADLPRLRKGGRFGRLVVPQGFTRLLTLPAFEALAKAMHPEIHEGIEEMSRITILDGRLLLDPRPSGVTHPGEKF